MHASILPLVIQEHDGVICAQLTASYLDVAEVPRIQDELIRATSSMTTPRIVVDLQGVQYLPTTALGMLVAIQTKVLKAGGQLRLAALSPQIDALIRTARLDRIFDIESSIHDAIASMCRT